MRFNAKNTARAFALAAALTVAGTPALGAAYQSEQGLEHGRGHDKNKNRDKNDAATNPNYQQGWNHGQEDRANHRVRQYRVPSGNDADRNAYRAGYDQGYLNGDRRYGQNGQYRNDRDRDDNGQYRNGQYGNGQYGPRGNGQYGGYSNQAGQIGSQDGVNDGQRDRATGHSNRPTQGDNYKNADRGYSSNFGSLSQYKAAYRQAYVQAYQQGYNDGYRR